MARSRKYLQPNTVCYLCSRPIEEGQDWNRDHIPPSRFFGSALKRSLNPVALPRQRTTVGRRSEKVKRSGRRTLQNPTGGS